MDPVFRSPVVWQVNTIQETTLVSPVPITVLVATTGQDHATPAKHRLLLTRLPTLADAHLRNF
jgi:hypothetical protein